MGVKPGAKMGRAAHLGFTISDADEPLLDKLSAPYREILVLSKGMTAGALAIALNVAPGTVKSRLNRARTALVALREATP